MPVPTKLDDSLDLIVSLLWVQQQLLLNSKGSGDDVVKVENIIDQFHFGTLQKIMKNDPKLEILLTSVSVQLRILEFTFCRRKDMMSYLHYIF